MKRLRFELVLLAVLVGVFLGRIPETFALRFDSYDFYDTVVDVRSELERNYVEEPDEKEMLSGAIEGMIESVDDPYTHYFSEEELKQFDKQTRASFSGVGAQINVNDTGQLVIVSPLEDSPAFKAGIMAGDIILAIDGEEVDDEVTTREAVSMITGKEGTDVTLTVRHPTGEEEPITITRQRIRIQTVKGFSRNAENHWDYMLDEDAGIAYARVTQFAQPTARALRRAIDQAKESGMEGLILDLRFNPGGLLSQAVAVSEMFLSDGKIVSTKGRNSPERSWEASEEGDVGDFPIIVMVNQFSASAAEIVTGALKDNERAIVLGTRSFGKGSVQQVMKLESGNGAIKVTTAYYYLPSGRNIHRREGAEKWGVDPNDGFYVPMTFEEIRDMNEARRAGDVVHGSGESGADEESGDSGENAGRAGDRVRPDEVTPRWLREKRSDPQLAAALKAMRMRLETGSFQPVSDKDNATILAHVAEKAELERRRDALEEGVEKVDQKLKEINKKINELGGSEEQRMASDETGEEGEGENDPAVEAELRKQTKEQAKTIEDQPAEEPEPEPATP